VCQGCRRHRASGCGLDTWTGWAKIHWAPGAGSISTAGLEAKAAGHFSGAADLSIELVSIRLQGANGPQDVSLLTQPLSNKAQGRGTNTAEKAGGGAALGAIIGGIAGGGAGAEIGALSGGVLGGGSNALSRGKEIVVKPEQLLPFRTSSPLEVTIVLVDGHQILPAAASGPPLQGRPISFMQPQ
jgi:hypothetical protein